MKLRSHLPCVFIVKIISPSHKYLFSTDHVPATVIRIIQNQAFLELCRHSFPLGKMPLFILLNDIYTEFKHQRELKYV